MSGLALHLVITILAHAVLWLGVVFVAAHVVRRSYRRTLALYRGTLGNPRRERLFLASLAFFLTVLVVRTITLSIHYDVGPFHNLSVEGTHIHHLVWGILLLLLVGYLWVAQLGTGAPHTAPAASRLTVLLYGIGAALTLDEFALWLHLQDVYWSREGRQSIEALLLFGALLSASLWGAPFLNALARDLGRRNDHVAPP
jgi:hypothetical protein